MSKVVFQAGCIVFFLYICFLPAGFAQDTRNSGENNTDINDMFSEGFGDEPAATPDLDQMFEDGFDSDAETGSGQTEKKKTSEIEKIISKLNPGGSIKLSVVYNFAHEKPENEVDIDWRGLSNLRGDFLFSLNPKLYKTWEVYLSVKGYGDLVYEESFYEDIWNVREFGRYPSVLIEEYRDEVEVGEAYIAGNILKNLSVKVGRQIAVWGKADVVRVTDIFNPSDFRFPGITTDIEDIRIPVLLSRLDVYFGKWNISGIVTHENRFNKYPVYGSDFYPYGRQFPEETPDEPEYGVAVNGMIRGTDLSFYYADYFDDTPNVDLFPSGIRHNRSTLVGAAMSVAVGEWLFKTEAALIDSLEYIHVPDQTFTRTDAMIGVEYYGFRNTTILVEMLDRHINNYDEALEGRFIQVYEDDVTAVFGITRTFMDELLNISLGGVAYGVTAENGSTVTVAANYSITDNIKAGGGVLFFQSGDAESLNDIDDNDRIFFNIKYSF